MKPLRHALLSLLVFAALPACADIRDTASERALSLPAGTPALVVPRGDWVISREQRRPQDSAVYYMLTSDGTKMGLSAFIDKTTTCTSADACLQEILRNPAYKESQDQKFTQAGPFKVTTFYLDQPMGTKIFQAHVLAEAYVDGHWFDVHISKAGSERPDMAPLLELLKSLSIR